jgi:hypothetical protein
MKRRSAGWIVAALVLAGLTAYTIVTVNSGGFTGQGGISEIAWLLVQQPSG